MIGELLFCGLLLTASPTEDAPTTLARKLEVALRAGDIDAELALYDRRGVAADILWYYMDIANDCFEGFDCHVNASPLTEQLREKVMPERSDMEYYLPLEGVLTISMDRAEADEHLKIRLAYAKVGDRYMIVGLHLTPHRIAALKATTAQALAEEWFAKGVGDPRDKHWRDKATVLPTGGGKAGFALNAQLAEESAAAKAAVRANDPDARMALEASPAGKYPYRKMESDGTPVSLKKRKGRLHAQTVLELTDFKVIGGYQRDDVYALMWEGHDGVGWLLRGCELGSFKNGKWVGIDHVKIAIPPD